MNDYFSVLLPLRIISFSSSTHCDSDFRCCILFISSAPHEISEDDLRRNYLLTSPDEEVLTIVGGQGVGVGRSRFAGGIECWCIFRCCVILCYTTLRWVFQWRHRMVMSYAVPWILLSLPSFPSQQRRNVFHLLSTVLNWSFLDDNRVVLFELSPNILEDANESDAGTGTWSSVVTKLWPCHTEYNISRGSLAISCYLRIVLFDALETFLRTWNRISSLSEKGEDNSLRYCSLYLIGIDVITTTTAILNFNAW